MNEIQLNIIQQSFAQFKQYGFKNVTMDDLARNIGISKKTIYENFKDKDELVLEVMKNILISNDCEMEESNKKAKNAIEQLFSILKIGEKMIQGMNLVSFMDLKKYYPEAYQYLEKHKQESMLKQIANNLQQGKNEGLFREEIDIEIMSKYRMETTMLMFQNNLFPQDRYNILEVNNEMFAHYMYGIATLKGHKMIDKYLNKEDEKCSFPNLFKSKK